MTENANMRKDITGQKGNEMKSSLVEGFNEYVKPQELVREVPKDNNVPAGNKETKPKPADGDNRFEVLSKRMSYWIDIARALMMIIVITSHYHQPGSQDYSSKIELLIPHILVSNGWGIVRSFFLLAGFFTMLSFDKMQKKYLKDTKEFIKQFVLQQFKRYFQLHAVMFMWGLGMGALYCWIFGERGDFRYYEGPRMLQYWIDFYLPIYWPNRIWRNIKYINGATWYNNSLAQTECLFYVALFLTYFIRKKQGDLAYALTFTLGMLAILVAMQLIWNPELHFDMFFYWGGAMIYWCRVGLIKTEIGKKLIDQIYSPKKKNIIIVWILSIGLAYTWLVTNRVQYEVHIVFLAILVLFDLFPYGKLPNVLDAFAKEMKRLQMEIYLIHQSFIWDNHPRLYPEIVPRDASTIRPTYVHWFVSWLLTVQFLVFSYPVHFVSKPFESIPQWIYDLATKKERKPDFWKNYWMSVVGIGIGGTLIALNQANAYGYPGPV